MRYGQHSGGGEYLSALNAVESHVLVVNVSDPLTN